MTARTMAPAPRSAYEIVLDFTAGADRLTRIAADWRQSQFRIGDLTDAASPPRVGTVFPPLSQFRIGDLTDAAHILEGLARLLAELRQEARQ